MSASSCISAKRRMPTARTLANGERTEHHVEAGTRPERESSREQLRAHFLYARERMREQLAKGSGTHAREVMPEREAHGLRGVERDGRAPLVVR